MEVSSGVISIIAASVGVPIIFGLLRKSKFLQPKKESLKSFNLLEKEYAKWETFALLPLFIFTPLIAFLLFYIQKFLSSFLISSLGESIFLLPPTNAIWWVTAFFLSMLLAAIPTHYLYLSILGKERYSEYTEYTNFKHGFDGLKVLRYMAYFFLPLCISFSVLAIDSYLHVTQDKFISNDFFSLGAREYSFDEIKQIELTKSLKAPNGKVVHRSFYSISFVDGYEYSFDKSVTEASFETQEQVISYIREKSTAVININDPYPREKQ